MTRTLAAFQDAFAAALGADVSAPQMASLAAQPGFIVYRNTVMKGCVDALLANYPAVARLVGDEWFRAAAAFFARDHLPVRPALVEYGDEFPDFLAAFEPAAELPYLADVARVERLWTEAHIAGDEEALAAGALASVSADRMACAVLRPHASARWAWFAGQPIFSIWRCNRDGADPGDLQTLAWRAEGVLLVRPGGSVQALELGAGGCAFMDACAVGSRLSDAGVAALDAEPQVDLAALLAQLLRAGAFAQILIATEREDSKQ